MRKGRESREGRERNSKELFASLETSHVLRAESWSSGFLVSVWPKGPFDRARLQLPGKGEQKIPDADDRG
jgi:hypothetical protein